MYFVSYKKISSPRQINIFYWISIASSGLSDESGRFNKKRQSNGRNFLVCIATADLRTDLEYGKSFMDELAVRSWCGREMLNGSILVFALMHPIEFVWFYRGDMKDGPIRMRSFAGLMILFLGVFASTVGSLGKKLTMVDPEPVMSMAQGVAMPGGIMARLDLFLIAFWIVGVFCVFSGYLFYGNESIKHAFSKGRIVGLSLSYGGIYVISPWIMTTFATWIRRYFFVFIYGNLVIGLFFHLFYF